MPELPEVRTVAVFLNKKVANLSILNTECFFEKMIWRNEVNEFKKEVSNQKILRVLNYGKYLMFEFKNSMMISHLRMEGKWSVSPKEIDIYNKNHLRLQFELSNGEYLKYYDSRKFGTIEIWGKDDYLELSGMDKLGPEPLNSKPSFKYLKDKATNSNSLIKAFVLDQSVLCGIGNIYANEILFAANIHPERITKSLTDKEIIKIIKASNKILERAIALKGTSIHSYKSGNGEVGQFQHELKVHLRRDEECFVCGSKIVKKQVAGRGTYFCKICQH
ncbi:DNA-formamidopyrimidine glycosylase [Mesoplasma entomophilum]|uniref:bifunctional DNA-formamidopyrimidine glycosylase/DNA-(apurinic or apyrimidinic site) lyase n=1 Tax=Mesoplasma entomophilum TaxID=2149 RepID=UPI000D03DBA2|nr:bifunctional DNA-formamidopyrimidine glycosylase/DNA-(apurinic or apyrimidinic site) lyase [Mesoplasma entomophilum]AVN60578.1 DNA-formamidopyrimidine glycosylase [Mesoplasma entomophilum]